MTLDFSCKNLNSNQKLNNNNNNAKIKRHQLRIKVGKIENYLFNPKSELQNKEKNRRL